MEIIKHEIGEMESPVQTTDQESAALDIIRTETVLSRLPIHNLAKKGNVNIQILKTGPDGKVELKWIVSYSDRYGQARQLAYKLDTIVINHHIDEQGRPLPKMICLGSLRDVADQLDLGGDTNKVRRALRQNASAFITAKFEYRGNDGTKKTLEADFTRYSVVFTGEQLPDGRRADAVYIILNEPYREVLNNAPVRPLDRAYMKTLPPAAQRFYEIISYKIFSAIKNDYPHAKIAYSEYCTFSAQLRHFERQPVQDQMAKIIRHHKESGYVTSVKYQSTIDAQNKPDWILYLAPGPRARAEFAAAHGGRKAPKKLGINTIEQGEPQRQSSHSERREFKSERAAPRPTFDPQLVAEFTSRGITEKRAQELLLNLKPGQDVIAQLEHTDYIVRNARIPIQNPPGFYIRLIESNTSIPESFETSAKRKAREENEQKERERRAAEDVRQILESEYDAYCSTETDRYIQDNAAAFEAMENAMRIANRERYTTFSQEMIESVAAHEARRELQKQIGLPTLEEFVNWKQQGTDLFLKPVGPSPAPELATVELESEDGTAKSDPSSVPADPAPTGETESAIVPPEPTAEAAIEATAEPEVPPLTPEPLMIELVSDPSQEEPGSSPAEPTLG